MRKFVFFVVLSSASLPAFAQCFVAVESIPKEVSSGTEYTISWAPVPGAKEYRVTEYRGLLGGTVISTFTVGSTQFKMSHQTSVDQLVSYLIVGAAELFDPTSILCSGQTSVRIHGDASLRTRFNRAIIPVVGSTRGANGARFRTSLRLTGRGDTTALTGRIVFHPEGQLASEHDPSMSYSVAGRERVEWDDVVEALGVNGIGTLDIIPDGVNHRSLPRIDVRLYNDTPDGTFGTSSPYFSASEATREFTTQEFENPADGSFRVNVGLVAVTDVIARVSVFNSLGQATTVGKQVFFEAGTMVMGTPQKVFTLTKWQPGDRAHIIWTGSGIPFHTLTENRTNDPDLFFPLQPRNVGAVEEIFK